MRVCVRVCVYVCVCMYAYMCVVCVCVCVCVEVDFFFFLWYKLIVYGNALIIIKRFSSLIPYDTVTYLKLHWWFEIHFGD